MIDLCYCLLMLLLSKTAQDLEKKWRSIRDNHIRNRRKNNEASKSGSGACKKKKYIYEDQLRFLEKSMELRTTNSSIPESPTQKIVLSILRVMEIIAGWIMMKKV